MSTSNYGCVESLNISVYFAKCVENVHTLIHYIHFGKKKMIEQSIHGKVSTH